MDRANDKSTELKLDPELVGHDPELADAVESIRNAVTPAGTRTRAQRPTADDTARADTIRVATVRRSSDDDEPLALDGNLERPSQRQILNVPSGFLTRALPLYWPPAATAIESRRRRGIVAIVLVLIFSLGLCVIAYVRNSNRDRNAPPPVAIHRPAPMHVHSALPVPSSNVQVDRAIATEVEATEPAAAPARATAEGASESVRHASATTRPPAKSVAEPPKATPATMASTSTEHKSWFEVR